MTETSQQASLTITREDQARALSQHVDFLGLFVTPRSPSEAAPTLGMAANLAHHHARRLADLGLLFEQRREGGRVFYQLVAREFRHAHDLLPAGDPDENMLAGLRALSEQFLAAHTRSWRVAEGEGDEGPTIYSFADRSEVPAPLQASRPAAEPHPAHFDALTLRLTPERYRQLAHRLTRLLNEAMQAAVAEPDAHGPPCTLAVLAYRGELRGGGKDLSRCASSFLGLEATTPT